MPSFLKFPILLFLGVFPLYLTQNRRKWLRALSWLWAWLLVARYGAFGFTRNAPVFTKVDFACLYAAGLKILKGLSPYSPTAPELFAELAKRGLEIKFIPTNFYHPLVSALAAPLTALPYPLAHGVYLSVQLSLLLALLVLAAREGYFRLHYLPGVALTLVLWEPLRHNLYLGQINLFTVAGLGALFLLDYSAPKHGVVLAGLSLIKPTYFLAHASYLKRGLWRALALAAALYALVSLPFARFMDDYFGTLLGASAHPILRREFNFSVYSLLQGLVGDGWAWLVHGLVALASVGVWLTLFWKKPLRERLAASIPASLLAVPVVVKYNLVALLWPGLLLWRDGGKFVRVAILLLWLLSSLRLPHRVEGLAVLVGIYALLISTSRLSPLR